MTLLLKWLPYRFSHAFLYLFQVELTGSSMFDYVHTSDHSEMADQLGVNLANSHRISPTSTNSMSPDVPEGLTVVNHGASPAIPDGKPCK